MSCSFYPPRFRSTKQTEMEYDGSLKSNIHYLNFSGRKRNNTLALGQKVTDSYSSVEREVINLRPSVPVHFIRPKAIEKAANWFINNFSGDVLYSVKSNPDSSVLTYLYNSGIKNFDVASLNEVRLISSLFPDASMYFMHPVKSREAIYEAYFNYGIRDFSLDSSLELKKILEVTNNAKDLSLHIRLAIPNGKAAIDLSGKFGILPNNSVALIRKCRSLAQKVGICFHVGSQCMEPTEYRNALMIVKDVLEKSKVKVDVIDVGGGFPSVYPGMNPPALINYMDEINNAFKALPVDRDCRLWCEPGRALVAESGSLLVRVESRKKNMLYINDGTYGGLFDAGYPRFIYPTRSIRTKSSVFSSNLVPFGFYGPTCDSLDVMKGPFYLPENIAEGDYIEIGGLGAYSKSIRTEFNGFNSLLQIEVDDEPLSSMYLESISEQEEKIANV